MSPRIRNMDEKADDGYSLLSHLQVLPGHSDNRQLRVKWDWSSMEIAQNLLQQAKILYYNDLDVGILGQEIIQDYKIKEFDLKNLYPDTKYLICFRVTRKKFPPLEIRNNKTLTIKSPLYQNVTKVIDKSFSNDNQLRHIIMKQTSVSQLTFNDISSLNRTEHLQSINIPKNNDEYVAEMKCQVAFTRFLHWTAVLCSLIGIIVALLLSITIFLVFKSRAYKTKHENRKMLLNQKGQLPGRRVGGGGENEEEEVSNSIQLHHSHAHTHHQHPHHHPYPAHHHHHHHCHHMPHQYSHNQNPSHYHCHLYSSSKKSLVKQEHCIQSHNHNRSKSSSSSSSCLKPSDKSGIVRDKPSRHNVTSEVICETHPIEYDHTSELHISEKQLEDWENELKNIEEFETVVSDVKAISLIKSTSSIVDNSDSNTAPIANTVKARKNSQNIPQDSILLLESIESVKEMESTRTVSFKDDTSMLCIATDVNSDNCKLNQHTIRKDLPNSTNLTSSQFNLTSPHREEFHDLNKPVSISVTESYLVHSRHHVPEYLSSENNNNDSILFITADSVTKPVNAITESSFSTTHIDFCKEYNHTYEIQSPLLKDCERKSHLFINDENFADSVFDTSRHAVCSEPSLIVTSPLLTTVQSTLLPVQTTPTNGKKTSLSTTENKTHLNTPIDSRKNTIQRDENWLLRSEELSSVLISQNEQKSIFHTQLVETL